MQVTVDDLRRRYEAMPDEELVALAKGGAMTPDADGVLREVLAAREIEPEPARQLGSLLPPPPPIFLPDFPKIWPGYLFAVAFLITEILFFASETVSTIGLVVISLGGWIYWLGCVKRLHEVLAAVTYNQYPIVPGSVVIRHFIPFYNLYWIFKWPGTLAEHLNGQVARQAMAPYVPGLLLVMFVLVGRFFDGALGLAGIFATLGYILRRVRPTVEIVQAVQEL